MVFVFYLNLNKYWEEYSIVKKWGGLLRFGR